jgi:hypothetical protein
MQPSSLRPTPPARAATTTTRPLAAPFARLHIGSVGVASAASVATATATPRPSLARRPSGLRPLLAVSCWLLCVCSRVLARETGRASVCESARLARECAKREGEGGDTKKSALAAHQPSLPHATPLHISFLAPHPQRAAAASSPGSSDSSGASRFAATAGKALAINLNPKWYGVFAEIGAGQEVARWFFRVGGAAGTIAKSVSAYDMLISDTMYGAAARYVTRERVEAMLEYEYLSCFLNLRKQRGRSTAFFAFADTVVARAFGRDNECHGWLGLKFQPTPGAPPSTVMLHVRMFDRTAQEQQEALGVLGVNFVSGVLSAADAACGVTKRGVAGGPGGAAPAPAPTPPGGEVIDFILAALLDDLDRSRLEVDAIDFAGPFFAAVDNRVAALRLVQQGLCDAALFDPSGALLVPHDALYKKNVLAVRGRFRPFTNLHNDMLMAAAQQFFCDNSSSAGGDVGSSLSSPVDGVASASTECVVRDDTLVLLELTTRDMMEGGDLLDWTSNSGIQEDAFLQRIDALATMGYTVMISNYRRYFKLAAYLSTFTQEPIVIAMGVPTLRELFKDKHYADLPGGILEGFGRLLKFSVQLFVYPTLDPKTGELVTAANLKVDPQAQKLYEFILERGTIVPVAAFDRELLQHGDVSKRVAESIRAGTAEWEGLVPHHVRDQIKAFNLLGYRPAPAALPRGNGVGGATSALLAGEGEGVAVGEGAAVAAAAVGGGGGKKGVGGKRA